MPRPPKKTFNLLERIRLLKKSGLGVVKPPELDEEDQLRPLPERIRLILGVLQDKPLKTTDMNYLILYDIEDNKVRRLISKFLESRGCVRIQKSVFLAHSHHKKFDEIYKTLQEINEIYENSDSIILVPLNVSDARSMKLIGQNVSISQIVDPPNTVFI